MSAPFRVAAAVPAYDAASSIADVVRRTIDLVPEVLVVDDGSADSTADQARLAGARVLAHEGNRGKGRALRTAFADLFDRDYDAVVTLDADGQHLPEEIPRLLAAAGSADLVIGCREKLFLEMHGVRRTSNRVSSHLISALAGDTIRDVQSGFRLYRRALVRATGFPEARFEAESAIVVRATRLGFRIVTVPIRLGFADGRCTSHYRPLVDSVRIAAAVIRARLETVGWTSAPQS